MNTAVFQDRDFAGRRCPEKDERVIEHPRGKRLVGDLFGIQIRNASHITNQSIGMLRADHLYPDLYVLTARQNHRRISPLSSVIKKYKTND